MNTQEENIITKDIGIDTEINSRRKSKQNILFNKQYNIRKEGYVETYQIKNIQSSVVRETQRITDSFRNKIQDKQS